MPKKLINPITNNFGLKILGVVFALVLWMVIVNVEDPDKSVTFSIDVNVVNADYLTDAGKTYEILENSDVITFTVTGKRSIVETLEASDFKAVANIENIDDSLSMVPIVVTATRYSSQLEITKLNSYLLVEVERLISTSLDVEIVTTGTPAAGCFVDSAASSVSSITVSGPESVVSEIASARVTVDISDATDTVVGSVAIVLLDKGGYEVSTERLSMEVTDVTVTAVVLMEKKVSVAFVVDGDPAEGYLYEGLSCDVDTVYLVGSWDVLNAMETLTITADELSVDGATETLIIELSLSDFLPETVRLLDADTDLVTVTLSIVAEEPEETEEPEEEIADDETESEIEEETPEETDVSDE